MALSPTLDMVAVFGFLSMTEIVWSYQWLGGVMFTRCGIRLEGPAVFSVQVTIHLTYLSVKYRSFT